MPCHDRKNNAGLYRFIPDSNSHNNSRLFSFLFIVFYKNNYLSYVLTSQTQQ